jgi:hypothetical protein
LNTLHQHKAEFAENCEVLESKRQQESARRKMTIETASELKYKAQQVSELAQLTHDCNEYLLIQILQQHGRTFKGH